MSPYLNRVFLMGNLTRDPELKFTPQGTAITKFSIAVNRMYKAGDGEMKKQTDFFNIVVWGKQGENCSKYLSKGRAVHLEGRLQTRSYETQDHQKRTVTEVIADNVQFLGGGGGQRPTSEDEAGDYSSGNDFPESDGSSSTGESEVPF